MFKLVAELKPIVNKKVFYGLKGIFEGSLQPYENELQRQSCN